MKEIPKINDKFKIFYYYKYKNESFFQSIIETLKWIFKRDYLADISGDIRNAKDVFFISQLRKDYCELFDCIYSADTESQKSYIKVRFKHGCTCSLIPYLFKYLSVYGTTKWIPTSERKKIGFWHRIRMLAQYVSIIKLFDKIELFRFENIKRVIVLADAWIVENVLVDYCKLYKKKTICCQHGLFIDNIKEESIDQLNYFQLCCDKYLLWGEATKTLFLKYNATVNIQICGNPLINMNHEKSDIKYWGIICDQPRYHEYNQEIISIVENLAKKMNKKILVKLHPQENGGEKNYSFDAAICTFSKSIDSCNIIFGHTSTMLYHFLRKGYATYKYRSDIISNEYIEDLSFSDVDELTIKLNNNQNANCMNLGSRFIAYCGEDASHIYSEVLKLEC